MKVKDLILRLQALGPEWQDRDVTDGCAAFRAVLLDGGGFVVLDTHPYYADSAIDAEDYPVPQDPCSVCGRATGGCCTVRRDAPALIVCDEFGPVRPR